MALNQSDNVYQKLAHQPPHHRLFAIDFEIYSIYCYGARLGHQQDII
jgi:hypothetical protein